MDCTDFYAQLLIEASRYDPALRDALTHLPPLELPDDHYHCSCCGRVVIPKGTPDHPRRWLEAAVSIAKSIGRGSRYLVRGGCGIVKGLKPIMIKEAKARLCPLWLTFASPDEPVSETATTSGNSSSQVTRFQHRAYGKKQFNSWRSLGKPSGLRSTTGQLVNSVVLSKPVGSDKKPKFSVRAADATVELREPEHAGKGANSGGVPTDHKEATVKRVSLTSTRPAPKPTTYTEQKTRGTSDNTPIRSHTKEKLRHQSIDLKPPPTPSASPEPQAPSHPQTIPPPRIPVAPQTKATLSRLFTSHPQHKKLLHFDTLVAALEDAGLTAKRGGKCSGSAVTFKQRGGGSIVFHRPHPDPKLEFHKQRTWGMRLRKKFGWELETFVERGGG